MRWISFFSWHVAFALSASADTLALWNFESTVPQTITGFSNGIVNADIGSGNLSGHHSSASTLFTSGTGNGSANALTANRWASGDYWLVQVSTVGFQHIQLSFDQAANPTGPTNFTLAYSLNGSSFLNITTYQVFSMVFQGAWSPSTPDTDYSYAWDLSSITPLDNTPNVYLRFRDNVTSPAPQTANYYGYLDNVSITAAPIPEPGVISIVTIAAALALRRLRRPVLRPLGPAHPVRRFL